MSYRFSSYTRTVLGGALLSLAGSAADGWNGHQWGVPNISGAQDWDNGPEGAPKAAKASLR
jgi:hypothetical protein